jgi:hypothetical protein
LLPVIDRRTHAAGLLWGKYINFWNRKEQFWLFEELFFLRKVIEWRKQRCSGGNANTCP